MTTTWWVTVCEDCRRSTSGRCARHVNVVVASSLGVGAPVGPVLDIQPIRVPATTASAA